MVKSWMKNASGIKIQQLDIQQQALKLTANRFVCILNIFTIILGVIWLNYKTGVTITDPLISLELFSIIAEACPTIGGTFKISF